MLEPITLSQDELTEVLRRVAPNGKEYGAARICRLLAERHSVLTVQVNTKCSVGNISDQVRKLINPRIADLGLYVACTKPPYKVLNKFDQPSGQMLWSFFRDVAANDPVYEPDLDEALKGDLEHLREKYPDLVDEEPDNLDLWNDTLKDAGAE